MLSNPNSLIEKLEILGAAAKYDVACTSSGSDRAGKQGMLGNAVAAGICHSFAADGRCISLLKVLMSNACAYDCEYCLNRRSNDTKRAMFSPDELAELTINFYRRNYIEGLFLSSAVIKNPDYTTELMIRCLELLRNGYSFNGYIHAKAIPGTDPLLIERLGLLADRMSVNIELPSQSSLRILAPDKSKEDIIKPMTQISAGIQKSKNELMLFRSAQKFAPAGQGTQLIVGATPETDHKILKLSAALYKKFSLRRVFYSAYVPLVTGKNLPSIETRPPLLREHRLYQADWLLRFYGFSVDEILDENRPNLNPLVDPKCNWAINHLDQFPVDIMTAPRETLLRIPGIGVKSAERIIEARRFASLTYQDLKRLGVVLKRAKYFITVSGRMMERLKIDEGEVLNALSSGAANRVQYEGGVQLSLFDPTREDLQKCLSGQI